MNSTARSYEGRDLEAMSFARKYYASIADFFAPQLRGIVVEVGAGIGSFSPFILERGAEKLIAIEPSNEMYPRLAERHAGDGRIMTRNAFFTDLSEELAGSIDSVVYVNVLEHVEDDAAELARVHGALRPNGSICVFVPALSWLYSDFDASVGHYRRYERRSLRALAENAGFDVVTLRYFDILGIIPWFIFFTMLRQTLVPSMASAYDRLVMPFSLALEALVSPPIGKNLLLVARKTDSSRVHPATS
jgi:SAM-dependent methyltransferase